MDHDGDRGGMPSSTDDTVHDLPVRRRRPTFVSAAQHRADAIFAELRKARRAGDDTSDRS